MHFRTRQRVLRATIAAMKALIVANWKMNPSSLKEAKALLAATKRSAAKARNVSLIVAPPAIFLQPLASASRGRTVFAIQNAHAAEGGAHTGEISMLQAKDAKATHVIIGHAERRAAGESDTAVREKVAAAIAAGLTPILCVGEEIRGAGAEHFAVVREQVHAALDGLAANRVGKIIIAYEPVWAIGATKAMQPPQMHEMSIFIRKAIVEKFGDAGHGVKVLYGGSIDAENAATMLQGGDVRGLLVGRASTDAANFAELLRAVHNA